MNTQEIGYISKTHGLKGHVILRTNDGLDIDAEIIKSVFLVLNGSQVPYFIEECRPNNTGYILKLDEFTSPTKNKFILGASGKFIEDLFCGTDDSKSIYIFNSKYKSELLVK